MIAFHGSATAAEMMIPLLVHRRGQVLVRPGRPAGCSGRRHRLRRAARRHGRLLRLGGGAPAAGTAGPAGGGGAGRAARRGQLGQLRGAPVGVRSAMPGAAARAALPAGGLLPADLRRVSAASRRRDASFGTSSPLVERAPPWTRRSWTCRRARLFGPPAAIARLSAPGSRGVGAAPARSAWRSEQVSWPSSPPPGRSRTACWVVSAARVLEFLHPLPVDALWGVGERSGGGAAPARPAHRGRPGRGAARPAAPGGGRGVRAPPARAGLGSGPPAGVR